MRVRWVKKDKKKKKRHSPPPPPPPPHTKDHHHHPTPQNNNNNKKNKQKHTLLKKCLYNVEELDTEEEDRDMHGNTQENRWHRTGQYSLSEPKLSTTNVGVHQIDGWPPRADQVQSPDWVWPLLERERERGGGREWGALGGGGGRWGGGRKGGYRLIIIIDYLWRTIP